MDYIVDKDDVDAIKKQVKERSDSLLELVRERIAKKSNYKITQKTMKDINSHCENVYLFEMEMKRLRNLELEKLSQITNSRIYKFLRLFAWYKCKFFMLVNQKQQLTKEKFFLYYGK